MSVEDGDADTDPDGTDDRGRDPGRGPPVDRERLVALRRAFHRHPEPAWREFRTTARVVAELERIGVDEVHVGREAVDGDARMGVPEPEEIESWFERAREAGVDPELLARMEGGYTGAVAVLGRGSGPTVAIRVDIDGLPREESTDPDHRPAAEGFRSETGAMHACGHDAHATLGLATLEAVKAGEFRGTLKLIFQPAEEVVGGARAAVAAGHLDDIDHLLAVHVGLDHPTGEVVAGIEEFLAVEQFEATFHGAGAHAAASPNDGHNAMQAMAAAVSDLYGIARHRDGRTRVNAGVVEGGTAMNIVPERVCLLGEVRGETTDLKEYVRERAWTVLEGAAGMHDCEVTVESVGEAPGAESDDAVRAVVADVAGAVDGVERVLDRAPLGGSEDATVMMRRVQERGGTASYVCIGTDHPGPHHSATFDVDEASLPIGVGVLSGTIERLARDGEGR
jgi:aminobenzoyl-glutamate utilization protein A